MAYLLLGLMIIIVLSVIFNKWMPRFFCDKLNWHLTPKRVYHEGINLKGHCPRCGKEVIQDSQGNWF